MPQSSPKTPSRSRPTRDTHGEKTPTPDHGSINGYADGEKTPTPKWFPPQSRSPSHLTSSIYFSYIQPLWAMVGGLPAMGAMGIRTREG